MLNIVHSRTLSVHGGDQPLLPFRSLFPLDSFGLQCRDKPALPTEFFSLNSPRLRVEGGALQDCLAAAISVFLPRCCVVSSLGTTVWVFSSNPLAFLTFERPSAFSSRRPCSPPFSPLFYCGVGPVGHRHKVFIHVPKFPLASSFYFVGIRTC